MSWLLSCAALLMLFLSPGPLFAPPIGFSGSPYPPAGSGTRRQVPVVVNPPFLYDPSRDLYDWKIGKEGKEEIPSCYYDAYYGQYLGNCLLYQDAPGYSITVPNQIRR